MFNGKIKRGPKNIILMLPLMLTAILFGGCHGKTIFEKPGGFLAGTVTDSISDLPLVGAWIGNDSLPDSTDVFTDSLGYYLRFAGSPGIHRFVFCGNEGYLTQEKEYSVVSNDTTMLNFKLVRNQ